MKKFWGCFFILLFMVGCSNDDEVIADYKNQIVIHQEEIQQLKEEIEKIETVNAEHLGNLQIADKESRQVLRLISDGDFEGLKKAYNVEFEISDDGLLFNSPDGNAPFPVDLAKNPAYVGSFTQTDTGTDISYYIMDYEYDKTQLVYFHFDKDMNFKHIFVGAE